MANERLRAAINQAGLEPEQLADLIEVDVKTVERWLAGRTPHPRRRARIARALERPEQDLWPEAATRDAERDSGGEIQGAWARADDAGIPDWRELLEEALERIELLDYSLIGILATDGITEALAAKAEAGCRIRILIAAPDSIWVRARAHALGQAAEDQIGRSQLELEIEAARGYLQPLTSVDGVALRELYADPGHRILRFDQELLISPTLHRTASTDAPVLHLRRRHGGGLFDQFVAHLDTLARDTGQPIESAPGLYPDPRTHPDRYKPLTPETTARLEELRGRDHQNAKRGEQAVEQVRAELRRPTEPTHHTQPE